MTRLYTLCRLNDGFHWVLVASNGEILFVSESGFSTEDEALMDLRVRIQI